MKKVHFIVVGMIAVAIALFSLAGKDLSTYSTFSDAISSGGKVKVAGQLSKDKEMYYNPEEDPNYFSFFVRDAKGEERKVVLFAAKMSEQIVITGKMEGDEFHASDLLMKCPSKYKDEEIYIKSEKS